MEPDHFLFVILFFVLAISLCCGWVGGKWGGPGWVYSPHAGAVIALLIVVAHLMKWI